MTSLYHFFGMPENNTHYRYIKGVSTEHLFTVLHNDPFEHNGIHYKENELVGTTYKRGDSQNENYSFNHPGIAGRRA